MRKTEYIFISFTGVCRQINLEMATLNSLNMADLSHV